MHELMTGTDQQKSEQALIFVRRLEEAELSLQEQKNDDAPLDEKQKEYLHKIVKSIKELHLPKF